MLLFSSFKKGTKLQKERGDEPRFCVEHPREGALRGAGGRWVPDEGGEPDLPREGAEQLDEGGAVHAVLPSPVRGTGPVLRQGRRPEQVEERTRGPRGGRRHRPPVRRAGRRALQRPRPPPPP